MKKQKETHAWGIASMTIGILSLLFVFMPYFGLPLAILAIVFNSIQKKHVPDGFGVAGLVLGIIGILINTIMLLIVFLAVSLSFI